MVVMLSTVPVITTHQCSTLV